MLNTAPPKVCLIFDLQKEKNHTNTHTRFAPELEPDIHGPFHTTKLSDTTTFPSFFSAVLSSLLHVSTATEQGEEEEEGDIARLLSQHRRSQNRERKKKHMCISHSIHG